MRPPSRTRRRVLGIDLALKWESIGVAQIEFEDPAGPILSCATAVIQWPSDRQCSAESVSEAIDDYAVRNHIHGIAIDGPQGWRDAARPTSEGVGRLCERLTRTPGKSGKYGCCYPRTYLPWTEFSIEVFQRLERTGRAILVNETAARALPSPGKDKYYVAEVFPTFSWRSAGLAALPGHRKAPPPVVLDFARKLAATFKLPEGAITQDHDTLQGIVSALSMVGLLGGPIEPVGVGLPRRRQEAVQGIPDHCVEGIIWGMRGAARSSERRVAR